jgi:hypothetical protein
MQPALVETGLGFTDGSLRPHLPVTRGQLASLLVRADHLDS